MEFDTNFTLRNQQIQIANPSDILTEDLFSFLKKGEIHRTARKQIAAIMIEIAPDIPPKLVNYEEIETSEGTKIKFILALDVDEIAAFAKAAVKASSVHRYNRLVAELESGRVPEDKKAEIQQTIQELENVIPVIDSELRSLEIDTLLRTINISSSQVSEVSDPSPIKQVEELPDVVEAAVVSGGETQQMLEAQIFRLQQELNQLQNGGASIVPVQTNNLQTRIG